MNVNKNLRDKTGRNQAGAQAPYPPYRPPDDGRDRFRGDGPAVNPDPPHTHPHEQVTYVAEKEVMFFIGEESTRLAPRDMVAVPPTCPHRIQLLTPTARFL